MTSAPNAIDPIWYLDETVTHITTSTQAWETCNKSAYNLQAIKMKQVARVNIL